MSLEGGASLATIVGTGLGLIGLIAIFWQLRAQQQQQRVELGNFYIQRYWQIDDDLLIAEKGTEEHKRHRHRYLRLTEDEFDAARAGWLDSGQWRLWHAELVTERGCVALADDLRAVDPSGHLGFESIRACTSQRQADNAPHGIQTCAARHLSA